MAALNYHHLRYFWMIANENNLTRAAERLHISQSALSIQLRQLEESMGQKLFERQGKRLQLTEAGRIDELINLMHGRSAGERQLLRIGAVSTLSRNFQLELVRSLVQRSDVELVLHSGSLRELLAQMHTHTIDLVLSNRPLPLDAQANWHCHLLDEQAVSLVSKPDDDKTPFEFPQALNGKPLLVPGIESEIRAAFDFLLEQAGIRPIIIAEIDDMAMLRLLARESGHLTLVPPVVVLDELRQGLLVERYRITDIRERFYAITPSRRFPNTLVKDLLTTSLDSRIAEHDDIA